MLYKTYSKSDKTVQNVFIYDENRKCYSGLTNKQGGSNKREPEMKRRKLLW